MQATAKAHQIAVTPEMPGAPSAVDVYRAPDAPSAATMTMMGLIDKAVMSGNIDLVGKMMDYQERFEKNEARKAFNNALADAKAEIKPILKSRHVGFEAANGGKDVDYNHEDLAGIADHIDGILAKHGLFYRWKPTNDFDSGKVSVTCIVSHRLGHSEETPLHAKIDAGAGKNHLQALGSAITYLERYTLKAALGLASKHDDDGQAAGPRIHIEPDPGRTSQRQARQPEPVQPITSAQAIILRDKLAKAKEKGAVEAQFWVFAQATKVEEVAVDRYPTIISALKSRYGV